MLPRSDSTKLARSGLIANWLGPSVPTICPVIAGQGQTPRPIGFVSLGGQWRDATHFGDGIRASDVIRRLSINWIDEPESQVKAQAQVQYKMGKSNSGLSPNSHGPPFTQSTTEGMLWDLQDPNFKDPDTIWISWPNQTYKILLSRVASSAGQRIRPIL